jgi:xylulokinase
MYLGIDLGTSGLRALLVDEDGKAVATAEVGYPVSHPIPGWSEQDPADWLAAFRSVIADLLDRAGPQMAQLRGIGVAGQMHGATLLDRTGTVLRPCMLWNDTRSFEQAERLDASPDFRDLSGNIVFPGFTAPKVQWVAENEPDVFNRIAKILLPKDYLGHWLTGFFASDMSDSAGTAWMDVGARDWADTLLDQTGLSRDLMPDLYEGTQVVGSLRPELAVALGLPAGIAVVAGAGDNAAAACGVGALTEGDGFVSLGTSGVLLAAKSGFAPDPASAVHTFCHAVPGTWYQMGVILAATDSLNWLAGNLGSDAADLTGALGDKVSGPGRLRFLPYLSGERTPHNDSAIRGAFLGLDIGMGHAALTQAVLEGVSYALRDNLEALKSTGTDLSRVLAIGGGAQSRYWVELVATVLGLPVDLPKQGEFGAAMGAARLAICGVTGAAPADVMTKPEVLETIDPRTDLIPAYFAGWQAFRDTYPILKDLP